eukprot:403446_1
MTEANTLESWLTANNLSELSSILLENEICDLSDLTDCLDDESAIDEFMEELTISIGLKNKFKNALLLLLIAEKEKYIKEQENKIKSGAEVKWTDEIVYYEEQKIDKWNYYVISCKVHKKTCHQCYN